MQENYIFSVLFSTSKEDGELFDLLMLPISRNQTGAFYWMIAMVIMAIMNATVATLTLLFYSITCYIIYKVSYSLNPVDYDYTFHGFCASF